MIIDQIRDALKAQPFRPFAIRLADGTIYAIQHHDWISIPPSDRPREITCYTTMGDDYRSHWISVGLILEVMCPADPAAGGR